jgi:hypothetical protein
MRKDVIFSMRMESRVRDVLNEAAKKDHRSVASLLDKILIDYLTKEGFLKEPELDKERRKFSRKKINMPAKIILKEGSKDKPFPGAVHDISMGGALVAYPKGSKMTFTSMGGLPQFELCLEHSQADEELHFNCEVRRMHATGDEIQVGATFSDPKGSYLQKLSSYFM